MLKKLVKFVGDKGMRVDMLLMAILATTVGVFALALQTQNLFYSIVFFLLAILFLALFFTAPIARAITKIKKDNATKQFNDDIEKRDARIQMDARANKPIRVAFLLDLPSLWPAFASVYDALAKDQRFDPVIIAIPAIEDGEIVDYDSASFLEEAGLPFVRAYENDRYVDFGTLGFHYIFPSRPYDHVRPPKATNGWLQRYSRLCHITYGTCIFNGKILDIVCGFQHLRKYQIVFSETPDHTEIYEMKKRRFPSCETKIIEVGSPKFDSVYYGDFSRFADEQYEQVVLYTPRWSTAFNACSFLDYYEDFFQLAKDNPTILYICRLHPLAHHHFVGSGILTEEQWDEFLSAFESIPNAELDKNPDYYPAFKRADVLVSDMSSLMPEFMLTGKPIIFAQKKWQFNPFGKHISEGMYCCCKFEEIENVLLSLRNGNDPKLESRKEVMENYFLLGEKTSAELIREELAYDYHGISQNEGIEETTLD